MFRGRHARMLLYASSTAEKVSPPNATKDTKRERPLYSGSVDPNPYPSTKKYSSVEPFNPSSLQHHIHGPTTELREQFYELFHDGIWSQLSSSREESTQERVLAVQRGGLCNTHHLLKEPVRCLVAHEMISMCDPFASMSLLHHQIASQILPASHPSQENLQDGTLTACVCLDATVYAYPRENGTRYVLRSAPFEKDPYPTALLPVVNANVPNAGPVLLRAWVQHDGAPSTLQWIVCDIKEIGLKGTPTKLSRHADVDGVTIPSSQVLHPLSETHHRATLYHAASCHGATKMILHNTLRHLEARYLHDVDPPYAVLGQGCVQRDLMPLLADCVISAIVLTLPPILEVPLGFREMQVDLFQQTLQLCGKYVDEVTAGTYSNRLSLYRSFSNVAPRLVPELFQAPADLPTGPSPYWFLPLMKKCVPFRSVRRRLLNLGFAPNRVEMGRISILLNYRESLLRQAVADAKVDRQDPIQYGHAMSAAIAHYRRARTERVVFEAVTSFLRTLANDRDVNEPLQLCLWGYGLRILRRDLAWFLDAGVLHAGHGVHIEHQMGVIAGHMCHRASHYCEALSIPPQLKKSPMTGRGKTTPT